MNDESGCFYSSFTLAQYASTGHSDFCIGGAVARSSTLHQPHPWENWGLDSKPTFLVK
jgi:hypothetical protein